MENWLRIYEHYSYVVINPFLTFAYNFNSNSMSLHKQVRRVTTHVLSAMKQKNEKIAMITAYDYSMAKIVDQAGIDVILVGDSASNVMAGHETTVPITLNEISRFICC